MGTTSPRQITQIAFATRDLDASITFYARHLGIGPWLVLPTARFAYFAHPDTPETYLELLESTSSREAMYAHILRHGQGRDGKQPIRPLSQL